jgi:hypothetical protein
MRARQLAIALNNRVAQERQRAAVEPAETEMLPYMDAYGPAMQAYHKARMAALGILDVREAQLFEHLDVDRRAAEMMQRFR